MKKSLTFRVISGVIVASTLLILPATATAAVRELTRPPAAAMTAGGAGTAGGTAARTAETGAGYDSGTARRAEVPGAGKAMVQPVKPAASLPFRLSVPGAAASGVFGPTQGRPGNPQVTVSLKVTGRAPCGVLQLTRNGPADGIEWYTLGALCHGGTATFRTPVNRLWGSRALPSIRLCNGDSLGLAEGVDCDDFVPSRGA
jgi:hypothetical protein